MSHSMKRDPHYDELLARRGRIAAIARATGVTKQAVSGWRRIPAERAEVIAEALGLELWELRPDLWKPPPAV